MNKPQLSHILGRRKLIPLRDLRRLLRHTEPFLGAFTTGGIHHLMEPADSPLHLEGIEDPETLPVIVIPFPTRKFTSCAEFQPITLRPKRHPDGVQTDSAWFGGMQAWVVTTVYILVNPEGHTLVLYHLLNDPDSSAPLGPLVPGHRFTKLVLERAEQFISDGELHRLFYKQPK